jgi:hypothetical protein
MKKSQNAKWTEAQEARLRSMATKVPMEQLMKKIGRSRGAISAKAFSLRLSLDPRRNTDGVAPTKLRGPLRRTRGAGVSFSG